MIDFTPDPIAIQLGPLPVYWYGICYALGLLAAYQVMVREARRRGPRHRDHHQRPDHRGDRRAHRRAALPRHRPVGPLQGRPDHDPPADPARRRRRLRLRRVQRSRGVRRAPHRDDRGAGPTCAGSTSRSGAGPTSSRRRCSRCRRSVGSATSSTRSCTARRRTCPGGSRSSARTGSRQYACPAGSDPNATLGQHFQPLFLYESLSAILGLLFLLWLGRRFSDRLRPGDLLLIFFIWYARPGSCSSSCAPATTGRSAASRRPRSPRRSRSSSGDACSSSATLDRAVRAWPRSRPRSGRRPRRPTAPPRGRRAGQQRRRPSRRSRPRPSPTAEPTARPRSPRAAATRPGRPPERPTGAEPAGRRRRRPPPGRIAPEALAAARGGAVEGLDWLGRPPETQAPASSSGSLAIVARVVLFGALPVPGRGRGTRARPARRAGTSWSRPPTAAGWTRSSCSTPCRSSRGSGSSARVRRRSVLAGVRRCIHRIGGLLPVWRGGVGVEQARRRGPRGHRQRGGLRPDAGGDVSGPPGRIGPFRIGAALIALRTGAPIVLPRDGRDRGALPRSPDGRPDPAADDGRRAARARLGRPAAGRGHRARSSSWPAA